MYACISDIKLLHKIILKHTRVDVALKFPPPLLNLTFKEGLSYYFKLCQFCWKVFGCCSAFFHLHSFSQQNIHLIK